MTTGVSAAADSRFMDHALRLAARGLGRVWPNPAVGAIVVDPEGGTILGRGWTQPGGRPHAETVALARAGDLAHGATLYVSLEPCAHHGQTPPCADAVVKAGIGRVVVAIEDPDPRVAGKGITRLRDAGITVTVGVAATAARNLNRGFLKRVVDGRPLVTLKLATSLDGCIATVTGESRWITGDDARQRGHLLRATHDAILIGRGTAAADDPLLTCRIDGLSGVSPVRVVVDTEARLSLDSRLVRTARETATWLVTTERAPVERRDALRRSGVEIITVAPRDDEGVDLDATLRVLASRGITRVLVEGGAAIAGALVRHQLVDRIVWFRAPLIIGDDGRAAVAGLGVSALDAACRLQRLEFGAAGADIVETYEV